MSFLPQSKDKLSRLIGYSKLLIDVNMSMNVSIVVSVQALSTAIDW